MFALQIIHALLYCRLLSLTFTAQGFDMPSATQPPASFVCKDTVRAIALVRPSLREQVSGGLFIPLPPTPPYGALRSLPEGEGNTRP